MLLHTGVDQPWLPQTLQRLEELRREYMPKSLAGISLDEQTVAFPLAIDQDEPIKRFLSEVRAQAQPTAQSGAVINQGLRAPESALADVLRRLDWARLHGHDLTLGWWRGGQESVSGLSAQGAQILIVDSDPTSVDLLSYFSEREGMMVTTLNSGQAAIDLLDRLQYPPQLVIVECTLPYIDGFQVLQACRELSQGTPRVLMTSALKQDELIERAFEGGAHDFIYKPYHMAEVMARVKHALS
jgi:CheY-like chemotaxis protein